MKKEEIRALHTFMAMAYQQGFGSIFGGMIEPQERYPHECLNDGYELRKIEMFDKKGNPIENRERYSHLYHNDLKVSNLIFRKGGMCNGFRDGYCSLIHYVKEKGKREDGYSFGTHVIINHLGDIILEGKGISDYPSHCGGNLGKMKDTYYNLLTGEPVLTASSSGTIDGKTCVIVNHRYDWYDKETKVPVGIYKIDKVTCVFEKIDDIGKY